MRSTKKRLIVTAYLMVIVLLSSIFGSSAFAASSDPEPGTAPINVRSSSRMMASVAALSSSTALKPVVNETGFITLSLDAKAVETSAHDNIRVDKPSTGATVRSAFLATTDVWGSFYNNLNDGIVMLNNVPVHWSNTITAPYGSNNAWADVTSIIKPVVDAAPQGIVNIDYTETKYLDGSILAVIFDDPEVTVVNSVILLFGAQANSGDTFNVALANPINKSDANLALDFSLGISYGYQPGEQVSYISVNGQRLSSSAGGQDDGFSDNGGLITVGGIGDSNANPSNPYAGASSFRDDDELYNLLPFINDGDTKITVDTLNPSYDDNIFFAALSVSSANAIVGEGIILDPITAKADTGTNHTVNATLQDDNGNALPNKEVTFNIISGPNQSKTAIATTDASGKASFTYTSSSTGIDTITASFINSQGQKQVSNQAKMEWTQPPVVVPVLKFKYFNTDATYTFKAATDSVVDSNGNLYVSDFYNNTIVKFDSTGKLVSKYRVLGSNQASQFNKPSGLAVDAADNIYVADAYNNRIVMFKDSNNDSLISDSEWKAFGNTAGNGEMQFNRPMGITVVGTKAYVADTYNSRIAIFDVASDNAGWFTLGSNGVNNGQFKLPNDVTVDASGNIWVCDTFNNRVQKFDSNGQFIQSYSASLPYGIACAADGKVYVAERQTALIKCINGTEVYGGKGKAEGLFTSPVGVNVDPSGSIWVVDVTANKIQHSVIVYE